MSRTSDPDDQAQARTGGHQGHTTYQLVTAVSMTIGRGAAAHVITGLAGIAERDHVLDVGCGPGTAARQAAHRAATVTGVDPAPAMLRLGRWITSIRRIRNVTFVAGTAERLPLPDETATIVWAISSLHHWADHAAGLSQARRVLVPGGKILLAERIVRPGARGLAAHGMTLGQAEQLSSDLRSAGFTDVRTETCRAGLRRLVVVQARKPAPSQPDPI